MAASENPAASRGTRAGKTVLADLSDAVQDYQHGPLTDGRICNRVESRAVHECDDPVAQYEVLRKEGAVRR